MDARLRKRLRRILVAGALFVLALVLMHMGLLDAWFGPQGSLAAQLVLFAAPYLIAGYDVLAKAGRNIVHGDFLDENFLMSVATLGAFALVLFPDAEPHMSEGAAVMLFYQVGELFQSYAVGKSRKSIASMMDIAPDSAYRVEPDGTISEVDPAEVVPGQRIMVRPGQRVPLDGRVLEGTSALDTSAITGESLPREVAGGSDVFSGCINLSGALTIEVTSAYDDSTVARVLELVEGAASAKARTEAFITRFARWYTPVVVGLALLLAIACPLLLGQPFAPWIERGLVFLVVSCPCALVISVPLAFFGGIGGAARMGILVKGGTHLEVLARVGTVVFDKTGTLTSGSFAVETVEPSPGASLDATGLLGLAARVEALSSHPLARSVVTAARAACLPDALGGLADCREVGGMGVEACVEGSPVLVGSARLMEANGVALPPGECDRTSGTVLHVARDGIYQGRIVLADAPKPGAARAVEALRQLGVSQVVMLTGDHERAALATAERLGISRVRANLLPQHKVAAVEELLAANAGAPGRPALAFVGDGINDAPVLARADVGLAMGALGSGAAIEAADVVLMDDQPSKVAAAIAIARTTVGIARQNIAGALAVKVVVLALAALGLANMWLAVFADVGVAVLAILNAMRCMNVSAAQRFIR